MHTSSVEFAPALARKSIRIANVGDSEAIIDLLGRHESPDEERLVALLAHGDFFVLDGSPGSLWGLIHVEVSGNSARLSHLVVQPELRHNGLGRRLLAVAEAWARTVCCKDAEFEGALDEATDASARRLGYLRHETMPPSYSKAL